VKPDSAPGRLGLIDELLQNLNDCGFVHVLILQFAMSKRRADLLYLRGRPLYRCIDEHGA
jgi:hypothetical protein